MPVRTLKASLDGLQRIRRTRERLTEKHGWTVDSEQWLEEASKFLPEVKVGRNTSPGSVSIGTWKRFLSGKAIKAPTFKAFCRVLELNWEEIVETNALSPIQPNPSHFAIHGDEHQKNLLQPQQDWGRAPDASNFYGRTEELTLLERWIIDERCKLVGIVGLGGIGKTDLSVRLGKGGIGKSELSLKFARDAQNEFDYIIWRSLLNAPPLTEVLLDFISFLSDQKETDLRQGLEQQIAQLLQYLSQHRCLLILDNVESILDSDNDTGQYREGYEGYGELLGQVGKQSHQSCVLLTGREILNEINPTKNFNEKIRLLKLYGLNKSDGKKIFESVGRFFALEDDWESLIELYNGNPLALKLVAKYIQAVFACNISEFLKEEQLTFGNIESLLDWHFNRLSVQEQELMYWLSINRESTSRLELKEDVLSPESKERVTSTIYSLLERFLLEGTEQGFTLQPVLMEYTTKRLLRIINEEFSTQNICLLNSHALFKAQSKDYLRSVQKRLILQPLFERMYSLFGSERSFMECLQKILDQVRENRYQRGYVGGNILNILCQAKVDSRNFNFSCLTIRQAYLQDTFLQDINFAHANFDRTVFIQTLGNVLSVAFSSDGRFLATGDTNYNISVWNIKTGKPEVVFDSHTEWVRVVIFNHLDSNMLISGSEDHKIRIWSLSNRQCIKTLNVNVGLVLSVSVCPRGEAIACSGSNGKISLWNINNGECIRSWQGHNPTTRIWSIAWSADGRFLISGAEDSTVKLWNIETGECLKTFLGHTDGVRSVVFNQDQETIASGSGDKSIRLWDIVTGRCLASFHLHADKVYSLAFNPTNKRQLVSGSIDHTLRSWNIETGECLKTFKGHNEAISTISFSPDGQMFASGGNTIVKFWNINSSEPIKTLKSSADELWSIAFHPSRSRIVSSWQTGKIRLWNIDTSELIETIEGHASRCMSVRFSPNGQYFASASDDYTVKLWDANTNEWLRTLAGHNERVRAVTFSQDSRFIITGSNDGTVRLWNVTTGECIHILEEHRSRIWCVAFSPDGETLASGDDNGIIRLWNIRHNECIGIIEGHKNWVRSVAFSPNGKLLASGSNDRTAKIWDVETQQSTNLFSEHHTPVYSVAFSPNGKLFASGSDAPKLWDLVTGDCLATLQGHQLHVPSVDFSNHSPLLASGSLDGTVKLWNLNTYKSVATLRAPRPYEGMNITGAVGLTPSEKETLKSLGAVEHQQSS